MCLVSSIYFTKYIVGMEVKEKMGRKGKPNFCQMCPVCKRKFRHNVKCKRCGSRLTFRRGIFVKSNSELAQRYGCYSCKRTFTLPFDGIYVINPGESEE